MVHVRTNPDATRDGPNHCSDAYELGDVRLEGGGEVVHGGHFLLPGIVARAMSLPATGGRLAIGNGEIVRDFLHVADVVEAYLALLARGSAGEAYNVCSGEGTSVRLLAAAVLQRLGVTADISSDAGLMRAVDVPVLVGSNRKLRGATGWTPSRTRDDIIDDLIHAATR